ncbi:bifunctional diguanylate cyclase/phosphodiesterase [Blastococcus mobilis]|uniref:Diguanylate cyclase (GGDEF) domain-containing protein n=1 Tax=Blastococcus mobilis TaxID=1938746 RepID=A0A238Y0Q0_9ACTN|nr:EAL domain-containing protein [Blastococcus mobilis]SNR64805.1 diguanylate cyclase (GGDEF) domain-containing protein [Blastococcus mobilis]
MTAWGTTGDASSGAPVMTDFESAVQAALQDLQYRVGLDLWMVVRSDSDEPDPLATFAVGDLAVTTDAALAWLRTWWQLVDRDTPTVCGDLTRLPAGVVDASSTAGPGAEAAPFRALLAVRIPGDGGRPLGSLVAVGRAPRGPELATHVRSVQICAGLIGTLLRHELRLAEAARDAERTAPHAGTDALTGVRDRAAWEAAVRTEQVRAGRYGTPVSVVSVEVRGLDDVIAAQGSHVAEQLLARAADALVLQIQGGDLLARVGDHVFAVLLPGMGGAALSAFVERVRVALASAGVTAAVGAASRRAGTSIEQTWRDAEGARHGAAPSRVAIKAARSATDARGDTHPLRPSAGEADEEPGTGEHAVPTALTRNGSIDALLELAREQLRMDVALLGEFRGGEWLIHNTVKTVDLPVTARFVQRRDRTHCDLMVSGRIGSVVPDSAGHPLTAELPGVVEWGLRAYVGVPVHRRNGALWGSLCVLARDPDERLTERDAGVLRVIAAAVAEIVEADEVQADARRHTRALLDAMYAAGDPSPVYQPIVELGSSHLVGVEALSRFPSSGHGPDYWFGAAAVGLELDLELTALSRALEHAPDTGGFLSVNVSPATVMTDRFLDRLESAPVDRLVLELTEHTAVEDYDALLRRLAPARSAGLRLAVDDAGAGYASLRHVLALAPDLIKLDRSLVCDVGRDPVRAALAAALTTFADQIGAHVVAEGIETAEELAALQALSVPYGQGYHLGRPAPAGTFVHPAGYAGPERRKPDSPGAAIRPSAQPGASRGAGPQLSAGASPNLERRLHGQA